MLLSTPAISREGCKKAILSHELLFWLIKALFYFCLALKEADNLYYTAFLFYTKSPLCSTSARSERFPPFRTILALYRYSSYSHLGVRIVSLQVKRVLFQKSSSSCGAIVHHYTTNDLFFVISFFFFFPGSGLQLGNCPFTFKSPAELENSARVTALWFPSEILLPSSCLR